MLKIQRAVMKAEGLLHKLYPNKLNFEMKRPPATDMTNERCGLVSHLCVSAPRLGAGCGLVLSYTGISCARGSMATPGLWSLMEQLRRPSHTGRALGFVKQGVQTGLLLELEHRQLEAVGGNRRRSLLCEDLIRCHCLLSWLLCH